MEKTATLNLRVNPIEVSLPKAPDSVNADRMTEEELHAKLQKGYDDMEAGRVRDAADAFAEFRNIRSRWKG